MTTHRTNRSRGRGAVLFAALVLAAVGASAAAAATLSEPPPIEVEQQLQAEIDGMVEAGLDEDDPKVEMVEEQLEAIEEGIGEPAQEGGVDTGAALADAAEDDQELAEAEAEAAAPDARVGAEDDGFGWESGTVECEPVPGVLDVDEIEGATCLSVPQPDGTSRYVAVTPDGVVRTVHFGNDGDVARLDDTRLERPVSPGTALAPTPEGDVQVDPPDANAAPVELP